MPLSESPRLPMREDENKQEHRRNGEQRGNPEEAPQKHRHTACVGRIQCDDARSPDGKAGKDECRSSWWLITFLTSLAIGREHRDGGDKNNREGEDGEQQHVPKHRH